jgi:parallel beta-helix repeat protein
MAGAIIGVKHLIFLFKYLTMKNQFVSNFGLLVLFLVAPGCTNLIEPSIAPSIEPESVKMVYDGLDFSEPVILITDNNGIRITEPDQVIDCRGAILEGRQGVGELISVIKTSGITIRNCNFQGNTEAAISIYESNGITIQNNTFQDIRKPIELDYGGFSILVKGGDTIRIEDNDFDNNQIGILIEGEPDNYVENVQIERNTILNTWMTAAIKCRRCHHVTIAGNNLESNGKPEYFEQQRIVGIDLHEVNQAKVFDNTVTESSSDGIGVPGEVWEDKIVYSTQIEIYKNTVMDNGEQGIWAIAGKDISIHDNIIYCTKHCYTGCSGIFFEWDVSDSQIYNNEIIGRGDEYNGITIKNSYSNRITDNIIKNIGTGIFIEEVEGKQIIGDHDAVLEYVAPVNNMITNNEIDAGEFIVIDNENNIVKDNLNLQKNRIKVFIGRSILFGLPAVIIYIYYRLRKKKLRIDK